MIHLPASLLALFAGLALPSIAHAAMPPAAAWEIGPVVRGDNSSEGMPPTPRATGEPGNAWAIDIPLAGYGQVDAVTTAVRPLAGARRITLRYRIDAASGTRFIPDEARGEPATVSLYFQQAGDTWTARRRYASYRWYVPIRGVIPLVPGTRSITIGFNEVWSNVNGQSNSADPRGYAAALADTARIGIAFGSAGLRSHGIFATGRAKFTLLAFDID